MRPPPTEQVERRERGRAARVLMIAPLFPPAGAPTTAAAIRTRAMATGLSRAGHHVTIVCGMSRGTSPDRGEGLEVVAAPWLDLDGIAHAIGFRSDTVVEPRRGSGPARYPMVRSLAMKVLPDRYATWIPGAISVGRRFARGCDVIMSTGSPSAHIAARAVHGHRPWIADINDLWAYNTQDLRRFIRDHTRSFIERETVGKATQLTTVNDMMRDELARRYSIPVATLLSGFDPADFGAPRPAGIRPPARIVFAGAVYPSLRLDWVLQAIREAKDEGWLDRSALQIAFVGRLSERVSAEAERCGVSDIVEGRAPIPRPDLLEELMAADGLLLPLYENDPYALPMRFFEYVGAGRPIIGFGPADRIAGRLIAEHSLGVVVSTRAELKQVLRRFVDGAPPLPHADPATQGLFTWETTVKNLQGLVLELTSRTNVGA